MSVLRFNDGLTFYLGTHVPSWLGLVDLPLFISRRTLMRYKTLPVATCDWVLDSGGFTELGSFGEWSITPKQYAKEVKRCQEEVGGLQWVAPMDYMCEPKVVKKTGLSVKEHQARTVENFLRLRDDLGDLVIPVLQGWTMSDYCSCVGMYDRAGVDLTSERLVGVGSVCRRNSKKEIDKILVRLALKGINLHAFGVKGDVLRDLRHIVSSADSMAWSYVARYGYLPMEGHTHKNCANCLEFAQWWYSDYMERLVGA